MTYNNLSHLCDDVVGNSTTALSRSPTTTPHTAFERSIPTSVQAQQLNTVHHHGNLNHNHATTPTTSHWTCHIINHLTQGCRVTLDPHPPTQREPAALPVTPFLPLPSLRDVGIQPCHHGWLDHDSGAVYPWQWGRGVAKVRVSGGQWAVNVGGSGIGINVAVWG